MSALDLSANKCDPLDMPNTDYEDPRMRLDCRTGASINISNSRIFVFGGCTLPIDLPTDFTIDTIHDEFINKLKENNNQIDMKIDFNYYLSAECFRLSLINRKWNHYKINESPAVVVKPEPRMFHNMSICDNYIYITGGLRFNKDNKLEILNDLWRFDTIDKSWKCYYENGNTEILKRFDHLSTELVNMEFLDKSLVHPGVCITGGINELGEYMNVLEVFDVLDDKLTIHKYPDLQEFQNLETSDHKIHNGIVLNLRQSKNTLYSITCSVSNQLKIFVSDKSPNVNSLEPFIIFTESTKGVRIPHKGDFDISGISTMHYATLGVFGENIILNGFISDEKKISAYIFNIRTSTWTKLNISCMHRLYTHKLSKGFVWESHHKAVFLGSITMKDTTGSVSYFDSLVVLSLPFTNFFGKKPLLHQHKSRFSKSSSSASLHSAIRLTKEFSPIITGTGMRRGSESINSTNSSFSHGRPHPILPEHTGGFAGYAYHVAQQLQINSIRSVLPSSAIAIGKNAFERNSAFSDFDLVCSDGTIIPVPLVLCRRRWGSGFDEIFAGAYARCFIESKAHDIISSKGSTYDSNESTENDEYSSVHSKNSAYTAPYFRYPFQDKNGHGNNRPHGYAHYRNGSSPVGDTHRTVSSSNSRHNSVSGSLFHVASLNRALKSLSDSRRNSYNIGQSQHNSVSYLPASRRGSINASMTSATNLNNSSPKRNSFNTNSVSSRRNSLNFNNMTLRRDSANMLQIAQANTRRSSTLSRTSFISSSSSSTPSCHGSKSIASGLEPLSPSSTKTKSLNDLSPIGPTDRNDSLSLHSHLASSESLNSLEDSIPHNILDSIRLDNLPPQLPMPSVVPDGSKSKSISSTLSETSNPEDTFTNNRNNSSIPHVFDDDLVSLIYSTDEQIENASQFNPVNLPRCLYLPYSKNTVRAIVEYMYSGQIGANWKLFPTGIELLIATKQLGMPLLYDLVLELFFVVLSIIESSLKAKLILYLEENSKLPNDESFDKIYSLLDVKGHDDFDMDLELLLEAACNTRRDSGATIDSDLTIDEVENMEKSEKTNDKNRSGSQVNGIDPLDFKSAKKGGPSLSACELSPTNTNADKIEGLGTNKTAVPTIIKDEGLNDKYDNIGITAASLDENGYVITDDGDSADDGEFFAGSFDKQELNEEDEASEDDGNEKEPKKKTKMKKWPTFKDMLNDDNVQIVNEIILELFIETGALINDSKLMLQSIHIQQLLKKLEDIETCKNVTSTSIQEKVKSNIQTHKTTNATTSTTTPTTFTDTNTNVTTVKEKAHNDARSQHENSSLSDSNKLTTDGVANEPIDLASAMITGDFGSSIFNLADEQAHDTKSDQVSITSTQPSINKPTTKKEVSKSHPLKQVTQFARSNSDVSLVSIPSTVARKGNYPSSREGSHIDELLQGNWKRKVATTDTTIGRTSTALPKKTASSLYNDNSNSLKTIFSGSSGSSDAGTIDKKKKKGFFSRFRH